MKLWTVIALVASLCLFGCDSGDGNDSARLQGITGPQTWGGAKNVMHRKHIYVSGQPDQEGFAQAAKNGVKIVVNLRAPSEINWDEKAAVEAAGMVYYNFPVARGGDSLNHDTMRQISELVQGHHDDPILLHCGSGNRVSAWLATHLATDHDMDTGQALDVARQMGLTQSGLEARVRNYLQNDVPAPALSGAHE